MTAYVPSLHCRLLTCKMGEWYLPHSGHGEKATRTYTSVLCRLRVGYSRASSRVSPAGTCKPTSYTSPQRALQPKGRMFRGRLVLTLLEGSIDSLSERRDCSQEKFIHSFICASSSSFIYSVVHSYIYSSSSDFLPGHCFRCWFVFLKFNLENDFITLWTWRGKGWGGGSGHTSPALLGKAVPGRA